MSNSSLDPFLLGSPSKRQTEARWLDGTFKPLKYFEGPLASSKFVAFCMVLHMEHLKVFHKKDKPKHSLGYYRMEHFPTEEMAYSTVGVPHVVFRQSTVGPLQYVPL